MTAFIQQEAIDQALQFAIRYGGTDGAHHKDWVIDQMVRALSGDKYDKLVADAMNGADGPNTYSWSIGIPP